MLICRDFFYLFISQYIWGTIFLKLNARIFIERERNCILSFCLLSNCVCVYTVHIVCVYGFVLEWRIVLNNCSKILNSMHIVR